MCHQMILDYTTDIDNDDEILTFDTTHKTDLLNLVLAIVGKYFSVTKNYFQ